MVVVVKVNADERERERIQKSAAKSGPTEMVSFLN